MLGLCPKLVTDINLDRFHAAGGAHEGDTRAHGSGPDDSY